MPNIGTLLKQEISRLSRREVRTQVGATKSATAQHRRHIAALKRQVTKLERQVSLLEQRVLGAPPLAPASSDAKADAVRRQGTAVATRSPRSLGGGLWKTGRRKLPSRSTTGSGV